jgi:hypothetical protein
MRKRYAVQDWTSDTPVQQILSTGGDWMADEDTEPTPPVYAKRELAFKFYCDEYRLAIGQ